MKLLCNCSTFIVTNLVRVGQFEIEWIHKSPFKYMLANYVDIWKWNGIYL